MAPKIVAKMEVGDVLAGEITKATNSVARFAAGIGASLSAVLVVPIALLAAPAVAAAESHRAAMRAIRASTGATGEKLTALGIVYSSVRIATTAAAEESAAAVGELHRRLGLAGSDLSAAAVAAVKLARASDAEVAATAGAVGRLMSAWGVGGAATAGSIGQLQTAARLADGGIVGLAAQLVQAAPAFRAAGLALGEASAMLADLARHGVAADDAIAGFRYALTLLSRGGPTGSMAAAFRTQIEAIRGSSSAAAAGTLAVATFGERGVAMADAIRRGALVFGGSATMIRIESRPVLTLSKAFGGLRIRVMQALEPLGEAIQRLSGPRAVARIQSLMDVADMMGRVAQAFGAFPRWMQSVTVVVLGVATLLGPVMLFVASVVLPIAGLAVVALKAIGLLGVLGGTLGILAAGAIAAWVASGTKLTTAAHGMGAAGIPAALLVAGGVLGGSMSAGMEMVDVAMGPAASPAVAAVAERLPAVAPALLPGIAPLNAIEAVRVVVAPLRFPALPAGPELPSASGTFGSEYGWERLVTARMEAREEITGAVRPAPTFVAISGQSLASSMRAHAARMGSWYGELSSVGVLPLTFAPGGWWALNRPESWLERADEVDRVQAQRQLVDAVWADRLAERSAREAEALRITSAFQAAFVDPTRAPISEEQFAAGLAGWQGDEITIGRPAAAQIVTGDQVATAVRVGLGAVM